MRWEEMLSGDSRTAHDAANEAAARRPGNLLDRQRMAGFWNRRADILEQIAAYEAAGDGFHVDRLLDELAEWGRDRTAFLESLS